MEPDGISGYFLEDDEPTTREIVSEEPAPSVYVKCWFVPWRSEKRIPPYEVQVWYGPLDHTKEYHDTEDAARLAVVRWCAAAIHAQQAERILAEAKAMGEGKDGH